MTTPSSLSLKKIYSGKVRDLYEIDAKRMLMVATDRLSAFDVILNEPIPEKGKILTAISNFWFDKLKDLVPNHFTGDKVEDIVPAAELPLVEGRAVVAKRLKPVAVEAIVRGYIVGSGWKEYQKSGTVCGIQLPAGLKEAAKLPQPIFTPSTKSAVGDHDENISFEQCEAIIGAELAAPEPQGPGGQQGHGGGQHKGREAVKPAVQQRGQSAQPPVQKSRPCGHSPWSMGSGTQPLRLLFMSFQTNYLMNQWFLWFSFGEV